MSGGATICLLVISCYAPPGNLLPVCTRAFPVDALADLFGMVIYFFTLVALQRLCLLLAGPCWCPALVGDACRLVDRVTVSVWIPTER